MHLQSLLKAEGHYGGMIDGLFGPKTEGAVLSFQKAKGLVADGIAGARTWGVLITKLSGQTVRHWYPTTFDQHALSQHEKAAMSFRAFIEASAEKHDIEPCVVAGLGSRESGWGLFLEPRGPTGTGDSGHGHGLLQIDDRFHRGFIRSGDWKDPQKNIAYGVAYLAEQLNELSGLDLTPQAHLRAGLVSYNAGRDDVYRALRLGHSLDYYTTGRDYSKDVLDRAGWFQREGW